MAKGRTSKAKQRRNQTSKKVKGELTTDKLTNLRKDFESNPGYRLIQNAITKTTVDNIALNRSAVIGSDHSFSHKLDDWKATEQKSSGRCWIFAATNLLRVGAMKKMKLKDFEFSQNHVLFWDKFEKANHFLEAIIETAERQVDDRTVSFLLQQPISDGGQWNMFVNVVKKHGLVPKAAMPESESSSNTGSMNKILVTKLRQAAKTLRNMHGDGASQNDLRHAKEDILKVIYRILCIHLGSPPARFEWQWTDKDNKFHRDPEMTPLQFADKYVTIPLEDYVCLVHDPRSTSPTGRTFTVEYLGNVVGGTMVKYLNVEIELMKKMALKTIQAGEPVWFGCDCGKMASRELGVWDAEMFDYESVYDTTLDLDKESRLLYGESAMNHAMLFTGVDVVKGKPRRWRVENSWGDKTGKSGFFLMTDQWFDEHMFEVAARKSALPPKLQAASEKPPIVLPPWDPMGSLAR